MESEREEIERGLRVREATEKEEEILQAECINECQ